MGKMNGIMCIRCGSIMDYTSNTVAGSTVYCWECRYEFHGEIEKYSTTKKEVIR